MKYDAKCANSSDPSKGLEPPLSSNCLGKSGNHSYQTYKNNGPNCACTGSRQIVSTPSGYPIAYIPLDDNTQDNAKSYCAALGWHLETNNEWMTAARNMEMVAANWCRPDGTDCGHEPGSAEKILARGYSQSPFDRALIATDDAHPCFGTGQNVTECGQTGSEKRTLQLTNGQIIWDFAGNVWQWVDYTIARKLQPQSQSGGTRDLGWLKSDFAPGSLPSVLIDNGQPPLTYDDFRPSNPMWNATNGVGRIYHYGSHHDTDSTHYAFIRGGNWKHGDDNGAFTVHMSPVPNKQNINDVGFRCVTSPLTVEESVQ